MNNTSEDYEINLPEFLSRPARKKIVEGLCEILLNEWLENREHGAGHNSRGRPPSSGVSLLASLIGVSRQSVGRWLAGEMQSCNMNAERLVDLALDHIPHVLQEVLLEDLDRHRIEVEICLGSMGVEQNAYRRSRT